MVERGQEEGVWGRHPLTSQPKAAPTLDRHECLAAGLGVKSHFPTRPMLGHSVPLASHHPALSSWLSVVREHPKAQPRLSGGISVRL